MTDADTVLREITEMRVELRMHIKQHDESIAWMDRIKALVDAHGDTEIVRARIEFVNLLLEREEEHKRLRRAVIEKGLLVAIGAALFFLATALGHELRDVFRGWTASK